MRKVGGDLRMQSSTSCRLAPREPVIMQVLCGAPAGSNSRHQVWETLGSGLGSRGACAKALQGPRFGGVAGDLLEVPHASAPATMRRTPTGSSNASTSRSSTGASTSARSGAPPSTPRRSSGTCSCSTRCGRPKARAGGGRTGRPADSHLFQAKASRKLDSAHIALASGMGPVWVDPSHTSGRRAVRPRPRPLRAGHRSPVGCTSVQACPLTFSPQSVPLIEKSPSYTWRPPAFTS